MISKKIAENFLQTKFEEIDIASFEPCKTNSDISSFLGIPLTNNDNYCYPKGHFENQKHTILKPLPAKYSQNRNVSVTINPNAYSAKKILILGDSFVTSLAKDLTKYFNQVNSAEITAFQKDKTYEQSVKFLFDGYKPDYVVFVFHDRFFSNIDIIKYLDTIKNN